MQFLGMTRRRIERALHVLVTQKVIRIAHRKDNALWVKVRHKQLEIIEKLAVIPGWSKKDQPEGRMVQKGPSGESERDHPEDKIAASNPNDDYELELDENPSKKPLKETLCEKTPEIHSNGHSFGYHAAAKTYKILLRERKIQRTPTLRSWERIFNDYVSYVKQRDGISTAEAESHISLILEDHLENITDQFQPKCYCADSICREFHRLIDAKDRRKNGWKKKTDDVGVW